MLGSRKLPPMRCTSSRLCSLIPSALKNKLEEHREKEADLKRDKRDLKKEKDSQEVGARCMPGHVGRGDGLEVNARRSGGGRMRTPPPRGEIGGGREGELNVGGRRDERWAIGGGGRG